MKKCIYVVEDNAAIRDVIEFMLTEDDYDVVISPTVHDFWAHMQLRTPDMVVLDIKLPDGNGLEICKELKSNIKTYAIPVMMMSANNYLSKVKSHCAADEFINKPFDLNDFAHRIEYHVAS
ncbi:DNA-binding response OmpR family regulator [Pedobacter africanus]|uniref:DNA-binding response OmpR family regulator n=1 Tax=Pedobacter africanus TaxID=151894 RepID=A0ACC6KS24_9SPHI|nr:response regulator [Pedobacter africanus]MDR6782006.1 DNA-binding response OmpR family regulator [Pedobacter africanus]